MITIKEVKPAINSDKLDSITFEEIGWSAVSQKGLHEAGKKVMFIPAESVLPFELGEKLEVTKYLSRGRLRAIKLRGNRSEGLIVDVDKVKPWLEYIMKWEDKPTIEMSGEASEGHPRFHKFYEMPNILNEPHVFEPGEKIYYSEKIHGCLTYRSKITMVDGSKKSITKIRAGEYVMGYEDGKLKPAKVLNVFDNGKGDTWLRVSGKRKCAGRGANIFTVFCTPNHRFWNPLVNEYVAANNLKPKDKVMLFRTELALTPIQEQILLGKLLGDGYIHNIKYSSSIEWSHKKEHEEYIDYTLNLLGDISSNNKSYFKSGYGTMMCRTSTVFLPYIQEIFKDFYFDDRKIIPRKVIQKLTPISLAFLYMDDGSLSYDENQADRASFALCNFDRDDCNVFLKALSKFDINGIYHNDEKTYSRIRINANDAEKLFLLIYPYIPTCMQYKLPERFRGREPYIPMQESIYNQRLINLEIDEIKEDRKIVSRKYDLETETHNFFSNDILVHNSNFRFAYLKDMDTEEYKPFVGSHNICLKESDTNIYWKVFKEKYEGRIPYDIVFYAEIYGLGIQDLHYGVKDPDAVIFAASYRGYYMTVPALKVICQDSNLVHIDFHFDKFRSIEQLRELADKPSEYTEDHIREGIVIVSAEYPDRMAKCLGDAYMDRKNKKERH
jgi:intein/homing endonuclease